MRPRERPIGNTITLSMDPEIRTKLEKIAKKQKRTLSKTVEYLIEIYKE